jgi:hypothetical protein
MTIDLTGIAVSAIAGIFGVVGPVFLYWLQSHMKDKQAADVLEAAVTNSLGAMQQAAEAGVESANPHILVAGVSPAIGVGVQYVMDHAGDEAGRFGITPASIADKINARVGLASIASNIATAASPAPTPKPLDPLPPPAGSPGQAAPPPPSVIPAKAGTQ